MTAGQAVVNALRAEGCKYVFGIVGVSFLDIADAFYDVDDIKFMSTRHEQGAACMASAYARISGQPGVCMATGGPGAANLVGGIYNAYMAHAPVIAISGNAGLEGVYREAGQELDHISMFRPITKLAMTMPKVERIPELMRHSFRVAMAGKKGPVFVDFPSDMMRYANIEGADIQQPEVYRIPQRNPGDPDLIRRAVQILKGARRPLVIAGRGVVESDGAQEVMELADMLSSPVVSSYRNNDAVPNAHPMYVGPFGTRGAPETGVLASKADVILAVGTRLIGFADLIKSGAVSPDTRIIQVEIDEKELGRNCPVAVGIQGDAKAVAQGLLDALRVEEPQGADPAWRNETESLKADRRQRLDEEGRSTGPLINPKRVYAELRKVTTPETIVILDAGAGAAYGYDRTDFQRPRTFLSPPTGGLGYSVPEALGAKLASPNSPVIAINGDGGFLFNEQEIETAVREKIATVTIVMNNGIWGSEKALQASYFQSRFVAADLTNPRFDKLAELYGAKGYYVDHIEDLAEIIKDAMAQAEVPSVIEVPVDPEVLPNLR